MSDQTYLLNLIASAVEDILEHHLQHQQAGIVVSGGLDSSTVACMAHRLGYDHMPLFTGWYDAPGFDEREWSRLVPGGERHEIQITPEDFVENFDAMAAAVRPPYQGMGTFGQFMVGKYIAENTDVKVVLSGEGSDELFGGYARQSIVAGAPIPDGYGDYVLPAGYPTDHREAVDYDYARLADLLAVDDQCMAAHGLLAVAPFTDDRIAAFAHGLNLADRVNKDFLRATVRGLVPDAIIDRTDKRGFPIPLVQWAQTDPVRTFVMDRLGYVPSPDKPWDRAWFHQLIVDATREPAAA